MNTKTRNEIIATLTKMGRKDLAQHIQATPFNKQEVLDFIKRNEQEMGEFKPRIKLFGPGGDTKFLSVTWDTLKGLAKIV